MYFYFTSDGGVDVFQIQTTITSEITSEMVSAIFGLLVQAILLLLS